MAEIGGFQVLLPCAPKQEFLRAIPSPVQTPSWPWTTNLPRHHDPLTASKSTSHVRKIPETVQKIQYHENEDYERKHQAGRYLSTTQGTRNWIRLK
jgi:hypothetical protein